MRFNLFVFVFALLALCANVMPAQVQTQVIQPAQVVSVPTVSNAAEQLFSEHAARSGVHAMSDGASNSQRLYFIPLINNLVLQNGEALTIDIVPILDHTSDISLFGQYVSASPRTGLPTTANPASYTADTASYFTGETGYYGFVRGGVRAFNVLHFHHLVVSASTSWGLHQIGVLLFEVKPKDVELLQQTTISFCVRVCGGSLGPYYIRQASVVTLSGYGRVLQLEGSFPLGVSFPVLVSIGGPGWINILYHVSTSDSGTILLAFVPELQNRGEVMTLSFGTVFPDGTASGARLLLGPPSPQPSGTSKD